MRKDHIQAWECGKCNKIGSVFVITQDDVMSVIYKIKDNHKEISPKCTNPVEKIRITNTEENNNES